MFSSFDDLRKKYVLFLKDYIISQPNVMIFFFKKPSHLLNYKVIELYYFYEEYNVGEWLVIFILN